MIRYHYAGYDFLAISDHWVPFMPQEEFYEDMLLISGCEYEAYYTERYYSSMRQIILHINGIGFSSVPALEKTPLSLRGQTIIDAIGNAGGISIFNHPAWSRNIPDDIRELKNLAGVEIFNTGSGFGSAQFGDSSWYIDQLALGGTFIPVMASDDAHSYQGEECRSFIMVQAEDLTRKSILEAINTGCFYASQGPWIHAEQKEQTIRIICSPVMEITVFTNSYFDGRFRNGELMTGAEYKINPGVSWYRIEITDEKGNKAWTSPREVK
jgi:hypothetical protein